MATPAVIRMPNEHVTVHILLRSGLSKTLRDMGYTYFDRDLDFYIVVGYGERHYFPIKEISTLEERRPHSDERIDYGNTDIFGNSSSVS